MLHSESNWAAKSDAGGDGAVGELLEPQAQHSSDTTKTSMFRVIGALFCGRTTGRCPVRQFDKYTADGAVLLASVSPFRLYLHIRGQEDNR